MKQLIWHDFESRDPRRPLVVLRTINLMGERATAHYIAEAIGAQRIDVIRAIQTLKKLYLVEFSKTGSVYRITDWGICDHNAVSRILGQSQ